jgi:hypothetical protein
MEMNRLTQKIGFHVARYLEKAKLIERDAENTYFADGRSIKIIKIRTKRAANNCI